jgi:hypothetical protein
MRAGIVVLSGGASDLFQSPNYEAVQRFAGKIGKDVWPLVAD